MAETFRNKMCAYNKGVIAAINGDDSCPYGSTKIELQDWWHAGHDDYTNRTVDMNMCYEKTLKKVGESTNPFS